VAELLKAVDSEEKPNIRVCENFACQLPVFDIDEARQMILKA
jgi:uncharacterized protein YyaL (SSP411 family)